MLTENELDAVMCTELAAIQELLQTDATTASIRKLRLIARTVEREAYKRAAAECRDIAQKYQTIGRTMQSNAGRLLYANMEASVLTAATAIEALGRQND